MDIESKSVAASSHSLKTWNTPKIAKLEVGKTLTGAYAWYEEVYDSEDRAVAYPST